MDPKYINPLYAYQAGQDRYGQKQAAASALAMQEVERKLKEIQAAREDEKITAEIMANKARSDAYAKQVALQGEALNRQKPYDEARAQDLKLSSLYAPLNAIESMSGTNIPAAAAAYNKIRDQLPPHIRALELEQDATFANKGQPPVLSRFNPEAMPGLMEGFGRPKTAADLEKERIKQEGAATRAAEANRTKLNIAQLNASVKRAIEDIKAGNPNTKMNVEQQLTQLLRSGDLNFNEFMQYATALRQAAAEASAAQDTPRTDMERLGLPTTTPRQQREKGNAPQLPQGWKVK